MNTDKKYIKSIIIYLITSFIVIYQCGVFAQTDKNKLQENKKKIEQEIKYNNYLLSETKKDKQNSINQLILLKNKINKREELINNLNEEIGTLNGEINYTQKSVEKLKSDLEMLKAEYAKMLIAANKNRGLYSIIAFLFASENFNQAIKRIKYYRQYSGYRRAQANMILKKQTELTQKKLQLENQKQNQNQLLIVNETEKKHLTQEKETKNTAIKQLQKTEKELIKTIRRKEAEAKKLERAIENIIAEEIRKAKEASRIRAENAKKTTLKEDKTTEKPVIKTNTDILTDTPEELALSNNFANNKGKLPWPLEKGIISGSFGPHSHPELPGIIINNDGIDITTNKGAVARSVFNGEVSAVIIGPNGKNVIIIRHGNFLSVYSNLENVFVRKGDKVNTKQRLGNISTDDEDNKTILQFQIWKGTRKLNPSDWISR